MGAFDTIEFTPRAGLEWPSPPFGVLAPRVMAGERVVLQMRNGVNQMGEISRFDAAAAMLEFTTTDGKGPGRPIAFREFKTLRFVDPRKVQQRDLGLAARADRVFPASEHQAFAVEFRDGKVFSSETMGHVRDKSGLYLYIMAEKGMVELCFVPAANIRNFSLGTPIGQMLMEAGAFAPQVLDAALERQGDLRNQRIGGYLEGKGLVSCEQIASALKQQESKPIMRLGEALQDMGIVTKAQIDEALSKQSQDRKLPLGQILVNMGIVKEETLKTVLAKKLGIPVVNLARFNVDPNAIKLVSPSLVYQYNVMPLYRTESDLITAMENPLEVVILDKLRFATSLRIVPVMAGRDEIRACIKSYYTGVPQSGIEVEDAEEITDGDYAFHKTGSDEKRIEHIASKLIAEDAALEIVKDEPVGDSDNTLVQLVNKMIMDAHEDGASDIHIESNPGKKPTRVRFRKDGALVDYLQVPANFRNAMISRLKIMCQMDISERRKPQDGKIDFKLYGPANIELRVATIPTSQGLEDMVLRLLSAAKPIPLLELGLDADRYTQLDKIMARPYGLMLVCGPTGSGKTTSLHSLLGHINTSERKIWTAEDPVEITQPGLRQVQMNSKIGWTFDVALRSFLRADPDVIMVGEMRDQGTAKIATEASLTGHLVLSTLHTNNAAESITRLLDLGMDPFSFSDALLGILAQRLVRRLCPHCKEAYVPDEQEMLDLAVEYCGDLGGHPHALVEEWKRTIWASGKAVLYRPTGCGRCATTGFQGRFGVYELLTSTPAMRRAIQTRAPVSELTRVAMDNGMCTLRQDGIRKVLGGHTDIQQVRAVCA